MKSLSAVLFLVALLSAPAFGQYACTVDLVFPQQTIRLSSTNCIQVSGLCGPLGCPQTMNLMEPVTIGPASPLAYVVFPTYMDLSGVFIREADNTIIQGWGGVMVAISCGSEACTHSAYAALNVTDTIFAGGFD